MALASDVVQVGFLPRQADIIGDTFASGLVATGTTQGTALALTAAINDIGTNAAGVNDGVKLPSILSTPYSRIAIRNSAVGTLKIYPASGDSIDSLATNVNDTLAAGSGQTYHKVSTSRWIKA